LIDAGLPAQDVPLALLAFNAGVEVGPLMFVGTVLAAGLALSRWRRPDLAPRARPALAYAIGTLAAFWFFDRLVGFWS
jgi:hypothetical protein